ncbi:unnamed protein product [Psylliodes chrysocephalus]|uniref:Uncharacterized protein n=1 Tax=Psylliodes chrysocephalus TaxID=3402493 RepID=A0A9P0GBU3_9CUCU|nr:unnamed protein product [Psylliodes chrysocephala]
MSEIQNSPPASPITEESCQLDCLLNLLELIWPMQGLLLQTIIQLLEMTVIVCQKEQYLNGKRLLKTFLPILTKLKKTKTSAISTITFEEFKVILKENAFYMTFCQTSLESKLLTFLKEVIIKNKKRKVSVRKKLAIAMSLCDKAFRRDFVGRVLTKISPGSVGYRDVTYKPTRAIYVLPLGTIHAQIAVASHLVNYAGSGAHRADKPIDASHFATGSSSTSGVKSI